MNFRGECFGGPEALEEKGQKLSGANSLRIRWKYLRAVILKFTGPKKEIEPKSALQNLVIRNRAFNTRVVVETNFEASDTLSSRHFEDSKIASTKAL